MHEHFGKLLSESVSQVVLQSNLSIPRLIIVTANSLSNGQRDSRHEPRHAHGASGNLGHCCQPVNHTAGLLGLGLLIDAGSLFDEPDIGVPQNRVEHVLRVLLEQQDHLCDIALHESGSI